MKPASQKITILITAAALLMSGCDPNASTESTPEYGTETIASEAEVEELLSRYLRFPMPSSGKKKLPEDLEPQNLLPKLNSWFTVGRGLKREWQITDDYAVYELERLPDKALDDLSKITFGSEKRVSFALLTTEFWQKVAALQRKGIRVAVLSAKNPTSVSGLYFRYYRLIAFDVFAEPGTLVHESRHHEQYEAREKYSYDAPQVLSKRCLRDASSAFGEIDATTHELYTYRGLANEFEVVPTDDILRTHEKDPFLFPQDTLFSIYLEYPWTAAGWITPDSECPADLNHAMSLIKGRAEFGRQRLFQPVFDLVIFRLRAYRAKRTLINNNCSVVDSEVCQLAKSDLDSAFAKETQAKVTFEQELEKEIHERPRDFREILNTISEPVKTDLCKHANGFLFLASCEEVLGD